VGILGGGSAGFLAAIALRTRRPDVDLTLIASSRLPPIGVGEGTTPIMVPFLHGYLGLDIERLFAEVRPTWKIGVKLEWGVPGDYFFHFPFDAHHLTESFHYRGDINSGSLGAKLMDRRAGLHLLRSDWSYHPLVRSLPYAYHLDNRRFVDYLQRMAAGLGVEPVDMLIAGAERDASGALAAVIADDGTRLEFDLYVDCSGFASRLLGEAMESAFISYASRLATDAAIVGGCDHRAPYGPFTLAQTMDAGWLWSLPQADEDHRGYVFCSPFLSADEAVEEMRRAVPGLGDTRLVRFRAGRRTDWWKRNVVAIGNSYGFVEPLEATALHMVVREITYVVGYLDEALHDARLRADLNAGMGLLWDNLSGLLALHYKLNRRRDTPFWRTVRAETDLGPIEPLVEAALERGPAPGATHDPGTGTLLGGLADEIDLLLLGMQAVSPDLVSPPTTPAEWREHHDRIDRLALRAPSARDSIRLAYDDPALVDPRGGRWYEDVLSGLERPVVPAEPP
jgi:tryptophan halogenase